MPLTSLTPATLTYPAQLAAYLGDQAPQSLTALGNLNLLQHHTLALFCSVKCPGSLILQSYDLAQNLRQADVAVISSFHSPIEKEYLTILLRGQQPLIVCPARGLAGMRLSAEWKEPLQQGRLLFLSSFSATQRRPTAKTAHYRNRLVAALADHIFITYAAPGGKTEKLCREFISWQKPVCTFKSEVNANLIELGAVPVRPDELVEVIK